jgi:hypothetical protein
MLNDEIADKTTCDPESFSYVLEGASYDNGYIYRELSRLCILNRSTDNTTELTLTQTVTLSSTNVTVKDVPDKFKAVGDEATGKSYTASDIIINTSSAVAWGV